MKPFFNPLSLILIVCTIFTVDASDAMLLDDTFIVDDNVTINSDNVDSVFAIGEKVTIDNSIAGSAHIIGNHIAIDDSINQSIYAIGRVIDVNQKVVDDSNLIGSEVNINAVIEGSLRAVADDITLNNTINGNAYIVANDLQINQLINGNLTLTVNSVTFGDNARINGHITIFTDDKNSIVIPDYIASSDQVTYEIASWMQSNASDYQKQAKDDSNWLGIVYKIIIISVLLLIFTKFGSNFVNNAGSRSKQIIKSIFLRGFLGVAIVAGTILLLLITLFGIPLALLLGFALFVLIVVSFWLGCYFIARNVWQLMTKSDVTNLSLLDSYLVCVIGVIIGVVVGFLPLTWLLMPLITLYGFGSINPWLFNRQ